MAFYHKDDRNYVKFNRKFNRLKIGEKLQYINYLVFKYCEHYAISPNVSENVLQDNNLAQLVLEDNDSPQHFISSDDMFFMMNK